MAEIKSTMDMVMERAARMAARSVEEPDSQESERTGMRLAAEYIALALDDLSQALAGQAAEQGRDIRTIVLDTGTMTAETFDACVAPETVMRLGSRTGIVRECPT